ncbi:MAG: hypothetical protein K2H23_06800 [Oscillospiraceae bacterium]|nr:hypothetical protein [Oscillospiraceae bacterium]
MPTNEKKGITVKIDAGLHAEVRQYLESHGMTMAEFVTQALQDELHPKITMQEEKNMGNMRTIAFQVPEELFQRIKDYLQNNNMTQKEFMLGLIENELNRDLTQRVEVTEAPQEIEESAGSNSEAISEEQDSAAVSEVFDETNDESEDIDEDEIEYMGMGMSM